MKYLSRTYLDIFHNLLLLDIDILDIEELSIPARNLRQFKVRLRVRPTLCQPIRRDSPREGSDEQFIAVWVQSLIIYNCFSISHEFQTSVYRHSFASELAPKEPIPKREHYIRIIC